MVLLAAAAVLASALFLALLLLPSLVRLLAALTGLLLLSAVLAALVLRLLLLIGWALFGVVGHAFLQKLPGWEPTGNGQSGNAFLLRAGIPEKRHAQAGVDRYRH